MNSSDSQPTELSEKERHKEINPELWVEQYGEVLFRAAMAKLADAATAEDLVQETLLSALQGYKRFQGTASFQTWLLGILKRKIADHYRHKQVVDRTVDKTNRFVTTETRDGHEESPSEFNSKGDWNSIPQPWNIRGGDSQTKKPDELAQDLEFWNVIDNCTGEMPEHLSRAFKQRALVGNKTTSICEEEGISQKNLSVRLHRARLLIRRCLEVRWFGDSD